MALFDSGYFNSPTSYVAGGFDTLMNSGAPMAGGGFSLSPNGGLLDNLAPMLQGGGLLGNYGSGGWLDTLRNAVATTSMPVRQLAATDSQPQPSSLPSSTPPSGGFWSGFGIGAWPGAAPQQPSFPTAPAPTAPMPPASTTTAPTPTAPMPPASTTTAPTPTGQPAPPLSLHPALPPSAAPQDSGPLGELGDWIGKNRWALMGLGAGIAGGSNWGEGINKGWQNAMAGRALDQQSTAENQTATALIKRGIDADTARAAARNPTMLRAVMGQGYGPQTRSSSLQNSAGLALPYRR
jgi:hypothetical protein